MRERRAVLRELLQAHVPQPHRGKLDAERQTIDASDDFTDDRILVPDPVRIADARPVRGRRKASWHPRA